MSLTPGVPGFSRRRPTDDGGILRPHTHATASEGGPIPVTSILTPGQLAYQDLANVFSAGNDFTGDAVFQGPNPVLFHFPYGIQLYDALGLGYTITQNMESLSANQQIVWPDNSGTLALIGGTAVQDFVDSLTRIVDNADATKRLRFEASGITAGQTRVLTVQDQDGILALLNALQTFTKAQTIQPDSDAVALLLRVHTAGVQDLVRGYDGAAARCFTLEAGGKLVAGETGGSAMPLRLVNGDVVSGFGVDISVLNLTADRQLDVPDSTGILLTTTSAATVSSKVMSTVGNFLRASTAGTGVSFADNSATTKRLYVILSSGSGNNALDVRGTARSYKLTDTSTPVPVLACGTPVDVSGQTAAIATTNLYTSPPADLYRVSVYAETTTAAGVGAATLDVTIGWTDRNGAQTLKVINGLALTATGYAEGDVRVRPNSGNITYATAINALLGTPQYAVTIRLERVGN